MKPDFWDSTDAVLFDLDGVLTPTDRIHEHAWKQLFTDYFASLAEPVAPYSEVDYRESLNGRPRLDGIRAVLASRGLTVPEHGPGSVEALGTTKDDVFRALLPVEGRDVYADAVRLLEYADAQGLATAVVSSSANALAVLDVAGLAGRFDLVVSGVTSKEAGLAGKPAPDPYLYAADRLRVAPDRTVVIEDAESGVRAGAAAGAYVIGIDRGAGADVLREAGADRVVASLDDVNPARAADRDADAR